jgi:hypothetical protein
MVRISVAISGDRKEAAWTSLHRAASSTGSGLDPFPQDGHEHQAGIGSALNRFENRLDLFEVALDKCGYDGVLRGEIPVEIADAHLRRLRQILHRCAVEAVEVRTPT